MRLIPIILFFCSQAVFSQISQPYRYELPREFNDDNFTVVSGKDFGVILFRDKKEFIDNKSDTWQFVVLDTTLNERLNFELEVQDNSVFLGYEFFEGTLYLLFQTGYSSRTDWIVNSIDIITGEISVTTIKNELDIELTHYIISGSSIVLGGTVESKPIIVLYSFEKDRVEVLPGFYRKETTLVELKANTNKTFNVVMLDKNQVSNDNIISIKVFSDEGVELLESTTNFGRDLKVQTGTISQLKTENLILIGTYGDKGSKLSKGFYFVNVKPGTNNEIKFTEFTEIASLFDFLDERRRKKIFDKIKESTQQNPYEIKVTVAVWDFKEEQNSYSVLTEIIDPQYGTNSTRSGYQPFSYNPYYMSRSAYYRNLYSTNDRDEVVSVKYREALLVSFDKNGKVKSNFSLPFEETIEHKV